MPEHSGYQSRFVALFCDACLPLRGQHTLALSIGFVFPV